MILASIELYKYLTGFLFFSMSSLTEKVFCNVFLDDIFKRPLTIPLYSVITAVSKVKDTAAGSEESVDNTATRR